MEEASDGGVGGGGAASSSSSTLLSGGGRQRFEVELRPGETTIVSWKKLIKDANKAANNKNDNKAPPPVVSAPPVPVPIPVAANPALDSRIAPVSAQGNTAEDEANDAPPGSRFSAVIEKIERLYMGKNSSDEEDLNDVPDDDEYDTEDSFIDDTELDEYFQVDNSAIKHDGFFVNRGKLERTNEPIVLPTEQPKKRRRKDKDSTKGYNGSNDGNVPNKHMKVNKKEGRKVVARSITLPTANCEDVKYQSPIIALGTVVKKPSDPKILMDPSPTKMLNGEAKVTVKNIEKQKTGILPSKKHGTKLKDGNLSLSPALPIQRSNDKSADVQLKPQGQLVNNSEELNQSVLPKEKNVVHEQVESKASEIGQQPKITHSVRKEGSSAKPKNTSLMLEKAIRDLEKIVAETRPPSMEVPEADNSSQAVKRRMPPEIKQKLAKVARLAHAIYGKLTKELLNRLMSIVGHLIQLRSLKRNLQNMVVMGISAKEEKDTRLQQLKKEVDEMVKIRVPLMKPEAIEQQAGSSDDFQETSTKEKALKTRFTTDDALEDKICDVYDLYVDGLDEDAGSQVRKLYAELAELWPKGLMDNHGIKRAICRAKERRKALHRRKEQENLKRKKLLASKTETLTVDGGSVQQHAPDKPVTDSSSAVRSISNTIAAAAAVAVSAQPSNVPTAEKPKQEKVKNSLNETMASEVLVKKKVKRKAAEGESDDGQFRHEKSTTSALQGEERRKSHKHTASAGPVKPAAAVQPSIVVTPVPASSTTTTSAAALLNLHSQQ